MPRIAIFCDGTWNAADAVQPTHVVRLFDAAQVSASQRTLYIPGVGTGGGGVLARLGAGAFGWGLGENVRRAYRALAMMYQPGDEIMIFGFSRGAYTGRSLAGMIRKCGMIDRPTKERVQAAWDLYRRAGPQNKPDALHIREARRAMSPRYATSGDDLTWRMSNPREDDPDDMRVLEIAYLGIWDTVGSLGVPVSLLGPVAVALNRQYRFHDTALSRMVKAARHAVGLDERRVFYRPSLWGNLEQTRDHEGLNGGDRTEARPYQQVWFTGTHPVIGGSGETRPLAVIPLEWVAQGAIARGLELATDPVDTPPDPTIASTEITEAPLLFRLAGALLEWRRGPGHPIDLHPSVRARVAARPDYRPRSLRHLMPELFGRDPVPGRAPTGGAER